MFAWHQVLAVCGRQFEMLRNMFRYGGKFVLVAIRCEL
jgi:hypothetical protein